MARDLPGLLTLAALISLTFAACGRQRSQAVFVPDTGTTTTDDTADVDPATPVITSMAIPIPLASDALIELATEVTVRLVLPQFDGSGVILGKDEHGYLYVLTAYHIAKLGVDQIELFSLVSSDPVVTLSGPELVSKSERRDLAILKVKVDPSIKVRAARLAGGNQEPPEFGYSAGCSSGQAPSVLSERITGIGRYQVAKSKKDAIMWTTERAQEVGRSGGPLLSVNGDLLGIALGKEKSVGYYCHSTEISDYFIDSNLESLLLCPKANE